MPWIRIDTWKTSGPEWAYELQRQAEEAERQDRLEHAFLAGVHTYQQGREERSN